MPNFNLNDFFTAFTSLKSRGVDSLKNVNANKDNKTNDKSSNNFNVNMQKFEDADEEIQLVISDNFDVDIPDDNDKINVVTGGNFDITERNDEVYLSYKNFDNSMLIQENGILTLISMENAENLKDVEMIYDDKNVLSFNYDGQEPITIKSVSKFNPSDNFKVDTFGDTMIVQEKGQITVIKVSDENEIGKVNITWDENSGVGINYDGDAQIDIQTLKSDLSNF